MSTNAPNPRRAFGKTVSDWQWAWSNATMVLQDNRKRAMVAIRQRHNGCWEAQVATGSQEFSENFFAVLDSAVRQLNLPWPVCLELRMIAAAEYERFRLLDEEFSKLKERGPNATVGD
jgi:hypothetical protein